MTPHAQWDALMALHADVVAGKISRDYFDIATFNQLPALAAEYRRLRNMAGIAADDSEHGALSWAADKIEAGAWKKGGAK